MDKPHPAPGLVDVLKGQVTSRVLKRLEGDAAYGADWAWTGGPAEWKVAAGEETVTVRADGGVVAAEGLGCTCLLAPKCVHVLAVARSLPESAAIAPTIAPIASPEPAGPKPADGLADVLRAQVSPRVAKKLDDPTYGTGWAWTQVDPSTWTVAADTETVTVSAPGATVTAESLRCTCLLSPKCAHVLAVGVRLVERSAAPVPPVVAESPAPIEPPKEQPEELITLTDEQRRAAAAVARAGVAILLNGASGSGKVQQEELVRAVHGARATGLHRVARAGTRVVRQIKALQRDRPEFVLDDLADDLHELLLVSRRLQDGTVGLRWIGEGRRSYDTVGTLRLFGLFTEPVLTHLGMNGVVTWMCDNRGRIWQIGDVRPRPAGQVRGVYDMAAAVGGVTLPHRRLGRDGIFVQNATASRDGRLGSGKDVSAVRAGPSRWDETGPRELWEEPLSKQLDRAYGAGRPAGGDLLFFTGAVLGASREVLCVNVGDSVVRMVTDTDQADVWYRENLRMLARSPGLKLRFVARLIAGRARTLVPLAVGPHPPEEGAPYLDLPPEWSDRVNLGLDRLQTAHIRGIRQEGVPFPLSDDLARDPLEASRRRVLRAAIGGISAFPAESAGAVEKDAHRLEAAMMPAGAAVLRGLCRAALVTSGRGPAFAEGWLAATTFDRAASKRLSRARWGI